MRRIFTGRSIRTLAYSPDGNTLAHAGWGHVSLLNVHDQRDETRHELGNSIVASVVFSPEGNFLAWACRGETIIRIEVLASRAVFVPETVTGTSPFGFAFLPDSGAIAISHGSIRLWDGSDTNPREPFIEQKVRVEGAIAMSRDGSLVATAPGKREGTATRDRADGLWLWNLQTRESPQRLTSPFRIPSRLTFSSDGHHIAGISERGLCVWNHKTRASIFERRSIGQNDVAFTPDGRYLIACGTERIIRMWETSTWHECAAFEWDVGFPRAIAIAPDGLTVAAGGEAGELVIWDLDG